MQLYIARKSILNYQALNDICNCTTTRKTVTQFISLTYEYMALLYAQLQLVHTSSISSRTPVAVVEYVSDDNNEESTTAVTSELVEYSNELLYSVEDKLSRASAERSLVGLTLFSSGVDKSGVLANFYVYDRPPPSQPSNDGPHPSQPSSTDVRICLSCGVMH
ncbi:uncharacterized protein LOC134188895 [Corticium candelabrum]|uniref:uncharacterized protein LOC134188895 n=1 Tax=Corticium candelabrum TaxID=121492 RepID=UPI002E2739F3|nr:uncharacterized protein LOC134188895 [Corticium candelabrum]XP_062513084.1 uncharacterized protein LOC134188895 [Corticium candelabrum]